MKKLIIEIADWVYIEDAIRRVAQVITWGKISWWYGKTKPWYCCLTTWKDWIKVYCPTRHKEKSYKFIVSDTL